MTASFRAVGLRFFWFWLSESFCRHWYVRYFGRNIGPSQVLRTQITNIVLKSPSWKANHTSSSQIPNILRNPEFHLRVRKLTSLSISISWSIQFTTLIQFLENPFQYHPPFTPMPSKQSLSLRFFQQALFASLLSPPPSYVPHVPSILIFSILSPEYYFVRCT